MKPLLVYILFAACFGQAYSQENVNVDAYVKTIDSLYTHHKLSVKEYPGRTFAGSLSGYYHNDTLVYINTLLDGEYGGIETKYYIKKDTVLCKVVCMSAGFKEPDEWKAYYAKHKKNQHCDDCHNTKQCIKTIIFPGSYSVQSTEKGKQLSLPASEKFKTMYNTLQTFASLRKLLKEI